MKPKSRVSSLLIAVVLFCITEQAYAQLSTNEKPISFSYPQISWETTAVVLPNIDTKNMEIEDSIDAENGMPLRFGYPHNVNLTLNNSGEWKELPNGDRLWHLEIVCPEAKSINLLYDNFWLPEGSKLFVFSKNKKQTIGAFTQQNNKGTRDSLNGFATGLIYGDTTVIEYYEPKGVSSSGILSIAKVIHGYRYISIETGNYERSGSCQVNVNCEEGTEWQNEKRAVAVIIIDGMYLCTGSLVNNTNNDYAPYMLTANHCLNGHDAEDNPNCSYWTFYWHYESPFCDNPTSEPSHYTTSGAVIVSNNIKSDFALLSLTEDPRNNSNIHPYYLGWDNSGNTGTGGVGIHHPKGDVKKIATYNIVPLTSNCMSSPYSNSDFLKIKWKSTDNGYSVTEGGSSGSPLINNNRHVIGQLYGAGSCDNMNCTNPSKDVGVYGKFSTSWNSNSNNKRKLQPWLDPENTGATTLNGIGPSYYSDLYIRDDETDNGNGPNNVSLMWNSPDIWIEDVNGNVCNPHGNTLCYVCVRIWNNSDMSSCGSERFFLNWAKAGCDLRWSNNWDGNHNFPCGNTPVMGGVIGTANGMPIPSIAAHQSRVVRIAWWTPMAEDYVGCTQFDSDRWHFCLVARIHDGDEVLYENSSNVDMGTFTTHNPNVAWKNISILDALYNTAVVSFSNPYDYLQRFRLRFNTKPNKAGDILFKHADVLIRLDDELVRLWKDGGGVCVGGRYLGENRFLVQEPDFYLENIVMPIDRHYTVEAGVRFFTQTTPLCNEFEFDIIEEGEKEIIGGEHYLAIKDSTKRFKAIALENKTVLAGDSTSFTAQAISEDAQYTWFSTVGDTLAIGDLLQTSQNTTRQYILEVVSIEDNYKDVDTVTVTVRRAAITALTPNPANNQTIVSYRLASDVTSASIVIANATGQVLYSAPLDVTQTTHTVNLQAIPTGQYTVRIEAQGSPLDSKTLIVY